MTLPAVAGVAVVALLLAATVLGGLTVLARAARRAIDRRRTRRAAPARRLLIPVAAGDADPALIDRLAAMDAAAWRAVEPTAVAMLGKVRGEAHAALVKVFVRRGAAARAYDDLEARGPVRRARAAELLGNLGERSAAPALSRLLGDANPDVRVVAARALGRIAEPSAAVPLLEAAGKASVPPQLVAHALIRLGPAAHADVAGAIHHPAELVRALAADVVGLTGAVGAARDVAAALRSDPSLDVRQRAARALGRLGTRSALTPLLEAMQADRPTTLRAEAARALGELAAPAASPQLAPLLGDPEYAVAHHAASALLRLGDAGRATLRAAAGAVPTPAGESPCAVRARDLVTAEQRRAAHAREALGTAALEEGRLSPLSAAAAQERSR